MHFPVHRRILRVGVAEHVAVHIPAAAYGVDHGLIDALDQRLQVALHDAVVLEGLAGGEADTAVAQLPCHRIDTQPLGRGADPAGQSGAQHEAVVGLQELLLALQPPVPVILLVEAVELADLGIVGREGAGSGIGHTLFQGTAQKVAVGFDPLVGIELDIHQ